MVSQARTLALCFACVVAGILSAAAPATAAFSFAQSPDYALGTNAADAVALADLDHKNGPDMVVGDVGGNVVVLLNKGDGTFGAPTSYHPCANGIDSLVVGQLTAGDQNPDVAASCSPYVVQLAGDGTGALGCCPPQVWTAGPNVGGLELGRMDGPTLVFRKGSPTPLYLCFIAVSDLETDLAGGSHNPTCDYDTGPSGDQVIPHNPIEGQIRLARYPTALNGSQAAFTYGVDNTGHHFLDIIVYRPDKAPAHTTPFASTAKRPSDGNLGGTFASTVAFPIAAGDVDGDGVTDVVMSDGSKLATYVPSYPLGTNQAPQTFGTLSNPDQIELADLDGDGIPDIETIGHGSDGTHITLAIHRGRGDGTFAPYQSIATHGYDDQTGQQMAIRDLNHDGRLDIVSLNRNNNTATVLLNTTPIPPPQTRRLKVSKHGKGRGRVKSTPAGINCGKTCAHRFIRGTAVTLRAKAKKGSKFAGWSGPCSGRKPCHVKMTADRRVGAKFKRKKHHHKKKH